jgi:hypothetical protein
MNNLPCIRIDNDQLMKELIVVQLANDYQDNWYTQKRSYLPKIIITPLQWGNKNS